jgi:hypothetical protein
LPVSASHTFTVPSRLRLTTRFPSGLRRHTLCNGRVPRECRAFLTRAIGHEDKRQQYTCQLRIYRAFHSRSVHPLPVLLNCATLVQVFIAVVAPAAMKAKKSPVKIPDL